MRILGLDIGDKRIGAAVSDKLEIISTPLEVFNNDIKIKEKLQKLINEYKIKKIVVGIPYTLKGEIGIQAKKVISFVEDIVMSTGIEVDYIDERYTTKIPLKLLKIKSKSKIIDKFSAGIILKDYLDRQKGKLKAVNNKFINKINLVIILLVIPLLSFYLVSCSLFRGEEKEIVPAGVEVEFEIKEGTTLKEIASLLEEKGIIDNAFFFRLFVEQRGKEKSLIPGIYTLETNSEYEDVLNKIVAGQPVVTYKFTIPEGYTVKQIIERVAQEIPFIEYQDMEQAVDISNYKYDYLEDASSLEGFLFPDTYEITIDYYARNIIEMMLAQYQFETGSLDYSFAEDKGFTRYDILKIASMIEREAYVPEERALISAVIHNRLDINMALGIDATLCYFLDKWDGNLTETDLEIDTEYNTRLYTGLPPTPICNPGLASIEAALNPADVDFLYYVVDDPVRHTHHFSIDYEEHTRVQNNTD